MDGLVAKFAGTLLQKPIKGDDFVDRMHHTITVAMLVIFASGSGLQEYVGDPINCWMPKEFEGATYQKHINNYCWTHKLRYPNHDQETSSSRTNTSKNGTGQNEAHVEYGSAFFRWVTIMFGLQSVLFMLPNFLWHRLNNSSGGDIQKIRDMVHEAQRADTEQEKTLKMDEVVAYFENWITGYKSYDQKLGKYSAAILQVFFCFGKKSGNYLSSLYLFTKFLNLLNVLGNFGLLSVFLRMNYWKYGLMVISSVIHSGNWHDPNFPSVLVCDFIVEGSFTSGNSSTNTHASHYNLQCTMTLNQILEKVFVVEWAWLIFLFCLTSVNALVWAVRIKPPCSTILFSKVYISTTSSPCVEAGVSTISQHGPPPDVSLVTERDFIENYLRSDGIFVLRILELNSDRTLVAELVKPLWERYRKKKYCNLGKHTNTSPHTSKDSLVAGVKVQ